MRYRSKVHLAVNESKHFLIFALVLINDLLQLMQLNLELRFDSLRELVQVSNLLCVLVVGICGLVALDLVFADHHMHALLLVDELAVEQLVLVQQRVMNSVNLLFEEDVALLDILF